MNKTNYEISGRVLRATRVFEAPLENVWRAWTEAELLDLWWAPKPWKSETKEMDFSEGGYRLYAMVGPEGEKHWGKTEYMTIVPQEQFTGQDVFCDENGTVNPEMPVASFENNFSQDGNQTTVVMLTTYPSEEQIEAVVRMGMKEGLAMAFENLDSVLSKM